MKAALQKTKSTEDTTPAGSSSQNINKHSQLLLKMTVCIMHLCRRVRLCVFANIIHMAWSHGAAKIPWEPYSTLPSIWSSR